MHTLYHQDNLTLSLASLPVNRYNLIFADTVYESFNFSWVSRYWNLLEKGGVLVVMSDYHSVAELKTRLDNLPGATFLNWLIWKNEFGNFAKDRFRQCHDDILIYAKGKHYKWYPERVQVPKVTAKSGGLNPSGRTTKIATSVITDICLTTVSTERIKDNSGKCVRWQKPLALIDRLISPFTDIGDWVLDPFMGTATTGVWCARKGRHFVGIEKDAQIFALAQQRMDAEG